MTAVVAERQKSSSEKPDYSEMAEFAAFITGQAGFAQDSRVDRLKGRRRTIETADGLQVPARQVVAGVPGDAPKPSNKSTEDFLDRAEQVLALYEVEMGRVAMDYNIAAPVHSGRLALQGSAELVA